MSDAESAKYSESFARPSNRLSLQLFYTKKMRFVTHSRFDWKVVRMPDLINRFHFQQIIIIEMIINFPK